jgi:hypothetical protein
VEYTRKDDCPSHEIDAPVVVLERSVSSTTAGEFLQIVRSDLGCDAVVEFNHDLLSGLHCANCDEFETLLASLGKVTEARGKCSQCEAPRTPHIYHALQGNEPFLDRTLAELGVPPWDVLAGRAHSSQRFYEFAGDREAVLGALRFQQSG